MVLSQCLLCFQNCPPPHKEKGNTTPFALIGRTLKAVFVLRELLRLPPEKLAEFMKSSGGDHPHEWIHFCDPCQALVEGAFSLHEQKVKINRKLKKAQEEVILKVRESLRAGGGKGSILEETRDFVRSHEYGAFENPFVAGDWEAEWRVEQQKVVQMLKKEEDDVEGQEDPEYSDNLADFPINSSGGEDEKAVKKPKRKRRRQPDNRPRPKQPLAKHDTFTDATTGKTLYRCLHPHCSKEFDNRPALYYHKRCHLDPHYDPQRNSTWVTCDLCNVSFLGHRGLSNHKTKAHPELYERPFPCAECPLSFTTANCRSVHVRINHRGVPPPPKKKKGAPHRRQCPHCPYHTAKSSHLQSHITQKHEGQQAFHCELCGTGVSREDVLRLHQAKHHSICGVARCRLPLETKEQLHQHQVTAHGKEVNVFRCGECLEFIVGVNNFKVHQQLKHPPPGEGVEGGGGQQHICELCGKGFPIVKYLKYHIKNTHERAWKKKGGVTKQEPINL